MRKFFIYLSNQHEIVLKSIIVIASIAAIVMMMPHHLGSELRMLCINQFMLTKISIACDDVGSCNHPRKLTSCLFWPAAACAVVRWTMWNTIFLVAVVQAHNTNPYWRSGACTAFELPTT